MDSSRVASLRSGYEASWRAERARVKLWGRLATAATLFFVFVLYYILWVKNQWSIGLVALSFMIIVTNLSRFVIYRVYLVPRFYRKLRSENAEEREAAWSLIASDRKLYLEPVVVERRDPASEEAILSLDAVAVSAYEDIDKIEWWEMFGRHFLIAWVLTTALVLAWVYYLSLQPSVAI